MGTKRKFSEIGKIGEQSWQLQDALWTDAASFIRQQHSHIYCNTTTSNQLVLGTTPQTCCHATLYCG